MGSSSLLALPGWVATTEIRNHSTVRHPFCTFKNMLSVLQNKAYQAAEQFLTWDSGNFFRPPWSIIAVAMLCKTVRKWNELLHVRDKKRWEKRCKESWRSKDSAQWAVHFLNCLVFLFVRKIKIYYNLLRYWAYLHVCFFPDSLLNC